MKNWRLGGVNDLPLSTLLAPEPGPITQPHLHAWPSFCPVTAAALHNLTSYGNVSTDIHETFEKESSVQLWLTTKMESF